MDELTLDGKTYVSSKRAAQITGYAKDYVGQLCREGRVEARQVGRNWYVLETSIREHRFGAEEAAAQAKSQAEAVRNAPPASPVSSWESPRYSSEASAPIPPIITESKEIETPMAHHAEPEAVASTAETRSTDAIVEEMQSAWRDWFSTKPRPILPAEPEEMLLDTPEVIDERAEEYAKQHQEETGDQPIPVAFEPVYASTAHEARQDTEEDEEVQNVVPVSILRPAEYSAAASAHEAMPTMGQAAPARSSYGSFDITPAPTRDLGKEIPQVVEIDRKMEDFPMGRIVHERTVKKPAPKRKSSAGMRAVLLAVAAAAIIIAVIGSGYIDISSIREIQNNPVISYIMGENSFNRAQ